MILNKKFIMVILIISIFIGCGPEDLDKKPYMIIHNIHIIDDIKLERYTLTVHNIDSDDWLDYLIITDSIGKYNIGDTIIFIKK